MARRTRSRSRRDRSSSPLVLVCLLAACGSVLALSACESDNATAGADGDSNQPAVVVSELGAHNGTPVPAQSQPAAAATDHTAFAGDAAPAGPRPSNSPVVERFERSNGLIIEDLKIGAGAVCLPGAAITFRHRAFLPNGTQWEESYSQEPAPSFTLNRGMPGWREGIPGMRVGGVRRLIIPPELGFGITGRRPGPDGPPAGVPVDDKGWIVPPGTTLTYEIELLDTSVPNFAAPKPAAKPAQAPKAPAPLPAPASDDRDINK